jgi:hypothetical protein
LKCLRRYAVVRLPSGLRTANPVTLRRRDRIVAEQHNCW